MSYTEEVELVIDYVERHLLTVECGDISRLAGMPASLFQRIFSYICGISLGDYVKRRRLTLAAEELLNGRGKVIDAAVKYGYDSHASFTRAFKSQFGVPPSEISAERLEANRFRRFAFEDNEKNYRMAGGKKIMAELVRMEYEYFDERKLVGIQKRVDFSSAGRFWREYFESGTFDRLGMLEPYLCKDVDDYIGLGYMCNFDEAGFAFDYIIGKYYEVSAPVPEGMASVYIPGATIAKAQIKGTLSDILNGAYFLLTEAMKINGYHPDYENFYWCDVYTRKRYCDPFERGEKTLVLDYFMPCRREER